jgi:hypothetical protein
MSTPNDGGPAFPVLPYHTGMTLRQYAAIHLRVPKSGTRWLDEMIFASLTDEFAKAALQGMTADPECALTPGDMAKWSYEYADEMKAERPMTKGDIA